MSVRNFAIYTILLLIAACASIGSPDGGPYDETAPVLLTSTPQLNSLNVKENKIILEFDEFIRLQNAYEKIVVSPPQIQQPEIKVNGKRIIVQLLDTLKPSTTYTIDFNDAIVDNNEGNPLESFSTRRPASSMTSRRTVSSARSPISQKPATRAMPLNSRPAYRVTRILSPWVTPTITAGAMTGKVRLPQSHSSARRVSW